MITIAEQDFKKLVTYIKENYGINLSKKKSLIEGRLSNLLLEKGFDNFSEYLHYVFQDETKLQITLIVNKITTNHTFFMRENVHFTYFEQTVLPYLQAVSRNKDLRIWSAGCSTGEEPYTLAMIMADYFNKEKILWDTKVLATDISVNVLETAEKGIYSQDDLHAVPLNWKLNYFLKKDADHYQISEQIKQEVIFRVFNLMDENFPFTQKFHVIFCRNVMIYFDYETKMRLIKKFYDMTESGGYLFIGHSESIDKVEAGYHYIMPAVYRKE